MQLAIFSCQAYVELITDGHTYTCRVTPTSRRSCTRSTVASTSLVYWSNTRTFHTGGPVGEATLRELAPFPVDWVTLLDDSIGLLRLRSVRRALVWDSWRVGGTALA